MVVGRVINEDDDFILMEFPKSDSHKFNLDDNPDQNQFYIMLFLRLKNGNPDFTKPWER